MMEEQKKTPQGKAVSGENAYAILAYLWILCLIPILMKKEDEFVKFHARQGLMLFIVEVGIAIIGIIPLLGPLVYMLGMLVCALLSLVGIVQVLMGNKWKMPVIGEWAEKINV
jgi:fumarate reductase subunit D